MSDSFFETHGLLGAADGLEELQIVTRGWPVAIRPDTPPVLKANLLAAVLGHQLGLKSVDYARRAYVEPNLPEDEELSPRYQIAYDATDSAKSLVVEAMDRFLALRNKPDHVGLFASGAALLRLVMTFRCAVYCIRNGFHFEFSALARLILEQVSWVYVIHTLDGDAPLNTQPQACVGKIKGLFPHLGPLYGHLSESGHIAPKRTRRYIDFTGTGDPDIVLVSDRFAHTDAFDLIALADVYSVLCEWLYAPRYGRLRYVELFPSGEKRPAPRRVALQTLRDFQVRIKQITEETGPGADAPVKAV